MTHLAILGSTRATELQAIIKAIENGSLDAKVDVVISNKADAYILERAKKYGLKTKFIDGKEITREEFDAKIMAELKKYSIDLILLIGYMRILSVPFVRAYKDRILNVHPSLLPAFAGGMDLNVHEEVIKAGVKETGCTVHFVDEGVDTGKILIQKKCAVEPNDNADTLKEKVQKLEGEALIEAIKIYNDKPLRLTYGAPLLLSIFALITFMWTIVNIRLSLLTTLIWMAALVLLMVFLKKE